MGLYLFFMDHSYFSVHLHFHKIFVLGSYDFLEILEVKTGEALSGKITAQIFSIQTIFSRIF